MMRIDYTKPVMFDRDTNGGLGAGTWQINPNFDHQSTRVRAPLPATRRTRVFARVFMAACLLGLLAGGVSTILGH
jgi:hypothetical protein